MSEIPILTDGAIELSAFTLDDVAPHVDGEDAETVTWLNEGHQSTVATTRAWAEQHLRWWSNGGPRRMFAIRKADTGTLAGMIEANLDNDACGLPAGEVNISFMVQSWTRGRGFATRAVELMCAYLERLEGVDVAVLRIHPDNTASLGVASRAKFDNAGRITTPDGDRLCYRRRVLRDAPQT
jgi:RimJ/RimL family protein N-acetyltransferase